MNDHSMLNETIEKRKIACGKHSSPIDVKQCNNGAIDSLNFKAKMVESQKDWLYSFK